MIETVLRIVGLIASASAYALVVTRLVILTRARPDLVPRWFAALFGTFVATCGVGFVLGVIDGAAWLGLESGWNVLTGGVAVLTAGVLFRATPIIVGWPSVVQLAQAQSAASISAAREVAATAYAQKEVAEARAAVLATVRDASSIPTPIIVVDQDLVIRIVNRDAVSLFEWPEAELVGQSIETLFSREHEDLSKYLERPIPRPMAGNAVMDVRRRNGATLHVRAFLRPEADTVLVFVFDQTQVVTTLRAQQRLNADLEQFAYAASHDLQEPLRAISWSLQRLVEGYSAALGDEGRNFLDRTLTAAERMSGMIAGLLAVSRAGRHALEPVATGPVLRDVLTTLDHVVHATGAEIATAGDAWEQRVQFNAAALASVFQNLLTNAVKYRREGASPAITVSAEHDAGGVRFAVADNGIGVPVNARPKLFDTFFRAHPSYQGHGIGLSVVKRSVENLGGRVGYEPGPAGGSVFWFWLRT